jgi:hypothetical protein
MMHFSVPSDKDTAKKLILEAKSYQAFYPTLQSTFPSLFS